MSRGAGAVAGAVAKGMSRGIPRTLLRSRGGTRSRIPPLVVAHARRRQRETKEVESLFSSSSSSSSSSPSSSSALKDEPTESRGDEKREGGGAEEGSRYDSIGKRRREHLRKFTVDTYELAETGRKGKGGEVSRRQLFRQTPVDAKVFERIKSLRLCEENRTAQRVAKGNVRAFKRDVSPAHKVPIHIRFYPFFGDLDPPVVRFLGMAQRDKLRLVTRCTSMKEVEEATESSLLPSCIEVAFAGRSNVGKSSLINALTLSSAAKSANVPGYTQSLHFYALKNQLSLVDMPGYGYASAGYDQVDTWNDLVDTYLLTRKKKILRRVYVVIDARHGIKINDREFMHMLSRKNVKFQVVMNKTDECKPSDLAKRWWHVNEEVKRLSNCVHRIHMCSSRTGAGVSEITKELYHLTHLVQQKEQKK